MEPNVAQPVSGHAKAVTNPAVHPPPFRPATFDLTKRQLIWLLLMQAVGSFIIDAAINFGIHVAVYNNDQPIHLFPFPNTIAGDMAVTLIVQNILTWIIGSMLQWGDVWNRRVEPLQTRSPSFFACAVNRIRTYLYLHENSGTGSLPVEDTVGYLKTASTLGKLLSWFIAVPDICRPRKNVVCPHWRRERDTEPHILAGNESKAAATANSASTTALPEWQMQYFQDSCKHGSKFKTVMDGLLGLALRGLLFSIPSFLLVWPITIGICAGIWGNTDYNKFPQTPLILAVYAGVLGFISGPILGLTVLYTAGRARAMQQRPAQHGMVQQGLQPDPNTVV